MRLSILAAVMVVCSTVSVLSQDYRTEIMRHVIDPCVMASARRSAPGTGVSAEQMAELIKMMNRDAYERAVQQMIPALRGKSWSQRQALYDWGLQQCLRGSGR